MSIFRRPARATSDRGARVIYQISSLCLQYPDDELLSRVGQFGAALDEQRESPAAQALRRFVAYLSTLRHRRPTDGGSLARLQQDYIEVFDLSRRQTLYLTYWSDGDTRRRGSALAALKQTYREADFLVDTHGELPDYLPMVLEFAARVDPAAGRQLLIEHRASLELIRIALQEKDSPYADVLVAVCATLPGESPKDKATALSMRTSSPAVERVGLESGDPRLLPLFTSKEMSMMTTTTGPNRHTPPHRTGVPR
ncbi:nitrate reductase molybdenum cofactor assembly chaperone [Gordonia iterans]